MSAVYPRDLHSSKVVSSSQAPRRERDRPRRIKRSPPQIKVESPESIQPKIGLGRILSLAGRTLGPVAGILYAQPTAQATADMPWMWQATGFDVPPELKGASVGRLNLETELDTPQPSQNDFKYVRPDLPEIPWQDFDVNVEGFTRSPKKGTVIVNVPDIWVPPPLRTDPMPEAEIWNVPDDVPFEHVWISPQLEPSPVLPEPVPSISPRAPARLGETGVTLEVSKEKGRIQLKIRPQRSRASRPRKKDTKAHRRWIKAAHKLVNVTYGTYSEIMDAAEAMAWNIYEERDGVRRPAMALEDGSMIQTFDGLIDGKYDLDIPQFIIDYAYMQSMDFLQGKFSQGVIDQSVDKGWWTSPQGPQGFVNNMQIKGM